MKDISDIFWDGVNAIYDGRTWHEGAEFDPDVFSDIYKDVYGVRPHALYNTIFGNERPDAKVARAMLELSPGTLHAITWPWEGDAPYRGMLHHSQCVQLGELPKNVLACILDLEHEAGKARVPARP